MKKFALTALAMFSLLIINAQVKIKPGIKIGLNNSTITNLERLSGGNKSSSTSFHAGTSVSFKFTDIYTLHPEILYSEQGGKLAIGTNSSKIKVNYLSLVINNKFYIAKSKFNLQVAPVLDFLVNHKNITPKPDGFDFAIMGGVGYDFPFGMTVDLRYKQGLADLYGRNVDTGNGFQDTNVENLLLNQVFQLSIGYQFDF
ncbi:porin family protein [Tenacibaculum maritimum]|uniref:porin family protein n=1 Tax=Tenacibaculum maritimum TaxID=107401 RepID=UPI0038763D09